MPPQAVGLPAMVPVSLGASVSVSAAAPGMLTAMPSVSLPVQGVHGIRAPQQVTFFGPTGAPHIAGPAAGHFHAIAAHSTGPAGLFQTTPMGAPIGSFPAPPHIAGITGPCHQNPNGIFQPFAALSNSAAPQQLPRLPTQPCPGALQPPQRHDSEAELSLKLQNDLAAKDRQIEDLSRYSASLQQVLLTERSKHGAQFADGCSDAERIREEVAAAASSCSLLGSDIGKAAEIASQLNAWFLENAAKMRTQESWASPSAYLERTTAELKQQLDGVNLRLGQVQSSLDAESLDQSAGAVGSNVQPVGSNMQPVGSSVQTAAPMMLHPQSVGGSTTTAPYTSGASGTISVFGQGGSTRHPAAAPQVQQPQLVGESGQASGPLGGTPRHSSVPPMQQGSQQELGQVSYTPTRGLPAVLSASSSTPGPTIASAAASTGGGSTTISPRAHGSSAALRLPVDATGTARESPVVRFSSAEAPILPVVSVSCDSVGASEELPMSPMDDELCSPGAGALPSYTSFHISKAI